MNFEKYYEYLKNKEKELCFENAESHGSEMYNMGVRSMMNYAMVAMMQVESEYNEEARKKVSA